MLAVCANLPQSSQEDGYSEYEGSHGSQYECPFGHFTVKQCLECPARFVPVDVRQTGMLKGPENQCQLEG